VRKITRAANGEVVFKLSGRMGKRVGNAVKRRREQSPRLLDLKDLTPRGSCRFS
jgi:hypothetical protein